MKTLSALIIYMAIGGFICGLSINHTSKLCKKPIEINDSEALAIIVWPALITIAIVTDEGTLNTSIACEYK